MSDLPTGTGCRTDILVCPETKRPLRELPRGEAEERMGGRLEPRRRTAVDDPSPTFGPTEVVLLRDDDEIAYPIVDGIPVLLVPEVLGAEGAARCFDLEDPKYAEAYEEMAFYNEVASKEAVDIRRSMSFGAVGAAREATREQCATFPAPRHVWLDATYDCAAQWDAYLHLAPLRDEQVLQLGGKGIHAVKFLLAGASEAWVVSPMLGELRCAEALARACGVEDRLRCAVAVAEELPFAPVSFGAAYSGGCVHHMVTSQALPEVSRVLRDGGRFGAVDPWRAPLYAIGTRVFGKREPDVHCRPLTRDRVEPLAAAFRDSRVEQHGTLTRYPLLALQKLGLSSRLETVWRLNGLDDRLCSLLPGFRRMGSSAALLGTK